jgi:hypothetical protein
MIRALAYAAFSLSSSAFFFTISYFMARALADAACLIALIWGAA